MSSIVNSGCVLQDASKTAIAWAAKAEEQMGGSVKVVMPCPGINEVSSI